MKPIDRRSKAIFKAVRRDITDGIEPDRLTRHCDRFVAHVARASGKRRVGARRVWQVVAATSVAVIAAVVVGFGVTRSAETETDLKFYVDNSNTHGRLHEWVAAPPERSVPIAFEGGTRFSLSGTAVAKVDTVNAEQVSVRLKAGRILADVNKKAGRRWTVAAGPYTVTVLGTRFAVTWDPTTQAFDLDVERGVVQVDGVGVNSLKVTKGHGLRAQNGAVTVDAVAALTKPEPPFEPVVENRGADLTDPIAPALDTETLPEVDTDKRLRHRARPAVSWQHYAAEQDFDKAFDAAAVEGLGALKAQLSPKPLWQLMEIARRVGEVDDALSILKIYKERFPNSEKSPIVPFMVGKIYSDQKRNPAAAARWFEIYLDASPNGPLKAEALRRLVLVNEKLGRDGIAKQYAVDYLNLNDKGAFAIHCRNLIGEN